MTFNQLGNTCLNNFLVLSNLGAIPRLLSVANLVDGAGSESLVSTSVAGGASDDAYYRALVAGGQIWTWGLDNSNSDKFVLSGAATLGAGTDVMQVYPAGQINYPLQPAFQARAVLQSNVTGDATLYPITFASEIFDIGNNFDGVSTFTAPVTGLYMLGAIVAIGDIVTPGHNELDLHLTTTSFDYLINTSNPSNCASAGSFYKIHGSVLANMAQGDTAFVQIFVGNDAKQIDVFATSCFYGWLVA